jgi:hypothetical protein
VGDTWYYILEGSQFLPKMDNYENFGKENGSAPEISVKSEATNSQEKADDVEIKVDNSADDGRLQIYKTEVQEDVDYVDDPGAKDIPRGGVE